MAMTVPQMQLPEVLPIFPLTGVMLLPGTVLPLHIFEPRYRAMVEDTLDGAKSKRYRHAVLVIFWAAHGLVI